MDKNIVLSPTSWTQFSDEKSHYSYVRKLPDQVAYEVVRVTHNKGTQTAEFVHTVFFPEDCTKDTLNDILRSSFGFTGLEEFTTGDIIDWLQVAGVMADYFDGREMPIIAADKLAQNIINK